MRKEEVTRGCKQGGVVGDTHERGGAEGESLKHQERRNRDYGLTNRLSGMRGNTG